MGGEIEKIRGNLAESRRLLQKAIEIQKKARVKLGPPSFLTKYLARDAARNRGISVTNKKPMKKKKNRKKRPVSAPSFYNKPRSKKRLATLDTDFTTLRFEAKKI